MNTLTVSFYDTKSYDRQAFLDAAGGDAGMECHFHEFRLSVETAASAAGCEAVCVFVNDRVDAACISMLAELGVKLIALRCAGFHAQLRAVSLALSGLFGRQCHVHPMGAGD